MLTLEAKIGQYCVDCGRPFKKGELVFEHVDGLICSDGCFSTPDPTKPAPSLYTADVTARKRNAQPKSMQVHAPAPERPTSELLQGDMDNKLRRDINDLAKKGGSK